MHVLGSALHGLNPILHKVFPRQNDYYVAKVFKPVNALIISRAQHILSSYSNPAPEHTFSPTLALMRAFIPPKVDTLRLLALLINRDRKIESF